MARITVIEDDESIRSLIEIALSSQYEVAAFESAEQFLKEVPHYRYFDLLVLDIMLPGMNGIDLMKQVRSKEQGNDTAILLLSAKDREIDKIIGLDGGADDYMTKPFGVMELMARIRNLLKRMKRQNVYENARLKVEQETRSVYLDQQLIELTYKEFELLWFLISNRRRVVPREELLNQIWGYEFIGESRTLDVHINSLRKKLKDYGSHIRSSRGVGYRFHEEEAA